MWKVIEKNSGFTSGAQISDNVSLVYVAKLGKQSTR